MESKEILYKPKDLYEKRLKRQYHESAEKYFDTLVKETGIDVEKNKKHVFQYEALCKKRTEMEDKLNSFEGLRGFFVFVVVIAFAAGIVCIMLGALDPEEKWWLFLIAALMIALGIFLIAYIVRKMNKELEFKKAALDKANEESKKKLKECYKDMRSLNSSFDWSLPSKIMHDVTNIIELDPYLSAAKFRYLRDKFGFAMENEENESALGILSGSIQGNPFVLKKTLSERYVDKTYTGSRTIYWTTYETDSKGNIITHHHSEVLYASSIHKAPFYSYSTMLAYGNEAAPHLHFSRQPSNINSLDERGRAKEVKRRMKEIRKKADDAIVEGSTFTQMYNEEFETFFGGTDRDNEVEFRLLFTPLAQTNIMSLLSDPKPYGDDFHMIKDGMCNYIISEHSQSFDYSSDPSIYVSYDCAASKKAFVDYCDKFIEHLFFDLAPLLSIPLYQMHKPSERIYEEDIEANYSFFEHEAIANLMDGSLFMPKGCDDSLPVLIKSISARKKGKADFVSMHVYSYRTTPKVDYISVYGDDGYWHDVPVYWTKYDRVDEDKILELAYTDLSKKAFSEKASNGETAHLTKAVARRYSFRRGMVSMVLEEGDIDPFFEEAFG